jgi:hypothetical protein
MTDPFDNDWDEDELETEDWDWLDEGVEDWPYYDDEGNTVIY